MTAKNTKALGPYNRYAIWVQGCERRCVGCISKDSQALDGGYIEDIDVLAADIINTPDIEGITISGGEPFLQLEELVNLITMVKAKKDIGVIVYTGYNFEEIKECKLTSLCDIIVDGAYIEELNDGLSLRGSSNQNICLITERYKKEAKELYGIQGRKIELYLLDGKTQMVGIPDKKTLSVLEGNSTQTFGKNT